MSNYPQPLLRLISLLKKFPGVGQRTAERFAFALLDWKETDLSTLSALLGTLKQEITSCPECGALTAEAHCPFCDLAKRDRSKLCIVASAKEIYAIEETRSYRGLYHVLGHLLSPLEGRFAHGLNLDKLKKRIKSLEVSEVIIAIDSTIEGDATSLFLKEELDKEGIFSSRLAFGLPMGSSLDYVDGGTLARAFAGRR